MATTGGVAELLRERVREHPDRPFLRCGDDRMTFAEADARSDAVAAGLAELGVRPGDRVATITPNRPEALELVFACAKLGAVHVPFNVFLKGDFLAYQLADCRPSVLVCDAAGCDAARAATDELPPMICLDERRLTSEASPPRPGLGPADLMAIVYTSGTTGMPKGCMLPHGYHTHAATGGREMMGYRTGDVLYTALPLFHGWARGIVMAALTWGLEAVIDPDFSASAASERMREVGATVFAGVGAMGTALLAQDAQPPPLRAALVIPFTPDQQDAFAERFGAAVLSQMYGQTETGAITYSRIDESGRPGTVGRASPSFDVAILDERDEPVPTDDVGQICVRPKVAWSTSLGYWDKPAETLEAWRNLWHHTGDLGRMDADGYVTFVDRVSDAVRRRGENVSSLQLEAAIARHPKVAEVAVHAVPSPVTEDDIKACVVLAPGETTSPEELFAFFRDALPYFAVPRYVEVVDALPRNATMRVMKHVLRERGVTPQTWDLETLGLVVEKEARR